MKIGIICGSGLDNPDILEDYKEIEIELISKRLNKIFDESPKIL